MNKKIFTLLACAFMLLSAVFTANAKVIGGNRSLGDTVRTLKEGQGANKGLYHIQIDSILLENSSGTLVWYSVRTGLDATNGSSAWADTKYHIGGTTSKNYLIDQNNTLHQKWIEGDSLVLAVQENGKVSPVSITDMRTKGRHADSINYLDLQSTMWCINITHRAFWGAYPTFDFTNKIFDLQLDFTPGQTYVTAKDEGWMFSESYDNGQLKSSRPLRRLTEGKPYNSTVLVYRGWDSYNPSTVAGIQAIDTATVAFTDEKIEGMLKFTIVAAAPYVLEADAFNTMFGNASDGLQQLIFDPASTDALKGPFENATGLYARPAKVGEKWGWKEDGYSNPVFPVDDYLADTLGYLNIAVGGKDFSRRIYNDSATYVNPSSHDKFLKILVGNPTVNQFQRSNDAYRFVYFPTEDSLVINAFQVWHVNDGLNGDGNYIDTVNINGTQGVIRKIDGLNPPKYYGLYNDTILNQLIVRSQQLYNGDGRLLTIGTYPANTRISFGVSCSAINVGVDIAPGVYTIWDTRGRILGVRIYNGTLAPQWIELEEGECPDRIPSFQWVVEKAPRGERINITSREFGDLPLAGGNERALQFNNVLVKKEATQIFKNQTKFIYGPLAVNNGGGSVTIDKALVAGEYLEMDNVDGCLLRASSGFRAVQPNYTQNAHLGYKWFNVNTDHGSVNYMKSENWKDEYGQWLGMDHNSFSFNFLHNFSEDFYINQKEGYNNEPVLALADKNETSFNFKIGSKLQARGYETERFGYPGYSVLNPSSLGRGVDTLFYPSYRQANGSIGTFEQKVAQLERYYYEMKISDFYNYRDDLSEQYVILCGANPDKFDVRNSLLYGLANVPNGQAQQFKFANVYLRETFFMQRPQKAGEERPVQDQSRRVFYAVLDRIEPDNFDRLFNFGLEVSDTMQSDDATKYGVVVWGYRDYNMTIVAQGRNVSSTRVSTFALENMNYELYRRLNSKTDDGAVSDDNLIAATPGSNNPQVQISLDAPKTLRFYRQFNPYEYLYEDAISSTGFNQQRINFLGVASINQFTEDYVAPDGTKKYNYNLFVDTAFINRGTGYIKPQYMIAVDRQIVPDTQITVEDPNCPNCSTIVKTLPGYVYARYLVNATDSARNLGSNGQNTNQIINGDYIINGSWDRLVFVPAIRDYQNDRLYILSQVQKQLTARGITPDKYTRPLNGQTVYDLEKLKDYADRGYLVERTWNNNAVYGAFYHFGNWDNYHNDVTFSLRFTEGGVKNAALATGEGGSDNLTKRFRIESETTQRNPYGNRKIAPVQGGWVKVNNGVAAVSHSSWEDAINAGDIFNVIPGTGEATSNDNVVTSAVQVVAGVEAVSILNAAGKSVTVTNLLGQIIARTVLTGDNATISVPKGMAVVQVEGEKAVKAVVK